MKTTVPSDVEIAQEALEILMKHMSPSKVARFMIAFQLGKGDYTKLRDKLFEGETVESLLAQAQKFNNK